MTPGRPRTAGVSPKVLNPGLAGLAVFAVLLVLGEKTTAVAVLLSAVGYGGVGAASRPGRVKGGA